MGKEKGSEWLDLGNKIEGGQLLRKQIEPGSGGGSFKHAAPPGSLKVAVLAAALLGTQHTLLRSWQTRLHDSPQPPQQNITADSCVLRSLLM